MSATPATTAPALPDYSKMSPEELAKGIRDKAFSMLNNYSRSIKDAIEIGVMLIAAKERVGHGNFEAWVVEHCQTSYRSARRYMKMAREREEIEEQMKVKMANLAKLNPPALLTDQRNGNGGGSEKNASDKYDAAEKKLVERLQDLKLDQVDAAIKATTDELKKTAATMKAGAKTA
jgi:hypothetical protein